MQLVRFMGLVLILYAMSATPTRADGPDRHWHLPHMRMAHRQPHVVSIVFNDDGTRVMAAYHIPAINRPGTDWETFVCQWDLRTGRRTIIPDAWLPLAFTEDEDHVIMGHIDPGRRREMRMHPQPAVSLWTFGHAQPERALGEDDDALLERIDDAEPDPTSHYPRNLQHESTGLHIVARSRQGRLFIHRAGNGRLRHTLLPAGGTVTAHPSSPIVAAADGRAIIRIWQSETGELLQTLRLDDVADNRVLVAAVQMPSTFGDVPGNERTLRSYVQSAAMQGASIVVLPEAALTGYLSIDLTQTWQVSDRPISEGMAGVDPATAASDVDDPIFPRFAELAAQHGIYLTVPFVEVDRKTGRYYNTVLLYGPDGERLIHYRKRNPWPRAERGWATEGNRGNPVVDTPFGRLGCLICFDIHEQAAIMADEQIDTLLYSIAWVDDAGSDWFTRQLPALAAQHDFNIIAANWTIPFNTAVSWHGYGFSRIIDREGRVRAEADSDHPQIVFAELPIPAPDVAVPFPGNLEAP
jgi:predicted amidohydrolase